MDRAALRARYSTIYDKYISVYQRLVSQKTMIKKLLRKPRRTGEDGSSASTSDEVELDDDCDILGTDELERLSAEYKRLERELEDVRKRFA